MPFSGIDEEETGNEAETNHRLIGFQALVKLLHHTTEGGQLFLFVEHIEQWRVIL